ncbi:arylsulfatase J-like [Dermacentor silvarum]|uniref:arylsulfatase J-like n=1 Tax=Dermacentor silvarum TaxID=543639 RepID=UPI002100F13D|nr:arylsulfatase J-like [Dermacentor silvarum]
MILTFLVLLTPSAVLAIKKPPHVIFIVAGRCVYIKQQNVLSARGLDAYEPVPLDSAVSISYLKTNHRDVLREHLRSRLQRDCYVSQGWADTSLVGGYQVPTPNLDALAAHGLLLTQHYSLHTCTPSRAAIMTGLYPIRMGLQHDVLIPAQEGGMDPKIPTLAERLKSLGYKTHGLGKWHLGYSSVELTPTRRGFDTFFGYYNTAKYYFTQGLNFYNICGRDFWDNEDLVSDADGVYDLDLVTDRAVDILSRHDTNEPLFMYMATLAAHGQTDTLTADAPERNLAKFPYIGDHNRTRLAGAVDALDESVGRIVEALHRRRMLSNSVIVFTSDNGGMPWGTFSNTGSNWPLRGVKGTMWEGGIRVPALVWSPLLRSGSRVVMSRPVHLVDWLPTLYSAAGGRVSHLGDIDGLDLWPALSMAKSDSAAIWPRNEFLINTDSSSGLSAYRDGNYKLVVISNRTAQTPNPFGHDELQQHVPTAGGMPEFENEEAAAEHLDRLMKYVAGLEDPEEAARPRRWFGSAIRLASEGCGAVLAAGSLSAGFRTAGRGSILVRHRT